ncbi:carbohydrate porin [Reyranella sp.]|uniref:carbohydrate porin n=1 Tax=Reyranella sp. TaxID=1929291 RepID=UPI003D0DFBA0
MRRVCQILAALLVGLITSTTVRAQAWWTELQDGFLPIPSVGTSLPNRGDPGGARKWLGDRGIVLGLEYTSDVLSVVSGGLRTGTVFQGKLQGILTVDFGKIGLDGLSLFANFFQIHNTGLIRQDYVGGLDTIAAIEALPSTRLSELWVEQSFLRGKGSLRVGQLAADSEFFFSDLATIFLEADWPTIAAANLPSGGAAYPLATPGIRLMVQPLPSLTMLFAVMNGDPAGPGPGNPQLRNYNGFNFRLSDPPFVIAEAQYRLHTGDSDSRLATTLKLGGWHSFGWFDDQRIANDGTLLADPSGSGIPLQRRGNSGLYGVLDQQLWRPKGGDSQSGVSFFTRASISPSAGSLIDRYIDGGIVFGGISAKRPYDRFGASVVHARFSPSATAFDRDTALYTGEPVVIRDSETNLELTYVAQIVPGWTVQPTLQFVWHPNGNSLLNAVVVGARSLIRY